VVRPALGAFNHEAAVVDPQTSMVYLTEDSPTGRLYRFTPATPGDLSSGALEAASLSGDTVTWRSTSAAQPDRQPTTTAFDGGEGAWIHGRSLFFTTKGNSRVYELGLDDQRLAILYDAAAVANAPLTGVDNITAHPASGDLFVAEDGGNMELCVIAWVGGVRQVAPFLRILGHAGSEVTGPAFSPDGRRLYLSSQRGSNGNGMTFEIAGPFRTSAGTDGSGGGTTTTTTTVPTTTSTPTTTTTMPTTTTTTAANLGPTAVFSAVVDSLQVGLDGSASSDSDGTVVSWAWAFGDGATATGTTTAHSYGSAGSYLVTLTVTDDDGAIASASQTVVVTVSGQPVLAQDAFGRNVSGGFGAADVGGPWSVSGTSSNFAVAGGAGRITLPSPGKTRSVSLTQVSARDVDARVDLSLASAPIGGGGYYSLIVRAVGDSGYGVRVRAQPTSTMVQLVRWVNRAATTLSTQTIPGFVASPGDVMHLRVQALGSSTTTLRATFWVNDQPAPTTWLLQDTDNTASLQAAGGIRVLAYLSSSSSGSAVLVVDQLSVVPATP
jgi:PKD repeat protein